LHAHVKHINPWLEIDQGPADQLCHSALGPIVIGLENELMNAATEIWTHHPLALRGSENERDRLGNALLIPRSGYGAACAYLQREFEANAEEIAG
jgi:hypothetical protein